MLHDQKPVNGTIELKIEPEPRVFWIKCIWCDFQ